MPGDVAGERTAAIVPAAIGLLCLGFQPRVNAQIIEHPVRLQLEQVVGIQFLRMFERSAGEAHGGQGQGSGGIGNGVGDDFGAGGKGDRRQRGNERAAAVGQELGKGMGEHRYGMHELSPDRFIHIHEMLC